MAIFEGHSSPREFCTTMILFYIYLSAMRKYIFQILRLDVYLLINYMLLKILIFLFKNTVFTFLIPSTLAFLQSHTVSIGFDPKYCVFIVESYFYGKIVW